MAALFFCCATCACVVSEILESIEEAALCGRRGAALVPRGRFAPVSAARRYREFVATRAGDRYSSADGECVVFDAGDFLLNEADVQYRIAPGAAFGCCGWQPRGELNVLCANGHAFGTVHADCWAPHVLRLKRACVSVQTIG